MQYHTYMHVYVQWLNDTLYIHVESTLNVSIQISLFLK